MKKSSYGRRSSSEPIRYGQEQVFGMPSLRPSAGTSVKKSHIPRPKSSAASTVKPKRSVSAGVSRVFLSHQKPRLTNAASAEDMRTPQTIRKYPFVEGSARSSVSEYSTQSCRVRKDKSALDKSNVKLFEHKVATFLVDNGFPNAVQFNNIRSMTSSSFLEIFNFIYSHILRKTAKQIGDIPEAMKQLGWNCQGIKSALMTVGSMHSWPRLVGLLVWLVQYIECMNCDLNEYLFDGLDGEAIVEEKLRNEFYLKSYHAWNQVGDEAVARENEAFEEDVRIAENILPGALEELEKEANMLEEKFKNLPYHNSCKEVEKLEAQMKAYCADEQALLLSIHEAKHYYKDIRLTQLSSLQRNVEDYKEKIADKGEEIQRLSEICENQEMSVQERDKIRSECEELERHIYRVKIEVEGTNKLIHACEIEMARKKNDFDELSAVFNTDLLHLETNMDKNELRIHSLDIDENTLQNSLSKFKQMKKSLKQEMKKDEVNEEKKHHKEAELRLRKILEHKQELMTTLEKEEKETHALSLEYEMKEKKMKSEIDSIKSKILAKNQQFPDIEALNASIEGKKAEIECLDKELIAIANNANDFFSKILPVAETNVSISLEAVRKFSEAMQEQQKKN